MSVLEYANALDKARLVIRLHNQTPTGRLRRCDPECVACAWLVLYDTAAPVLPSGVPNTPLLRVDDRESPFRYRYTDDCPDAATLHSGPPANMTASGFSPTHRQARCPTCRFWSVWEKKPKAKRVDWSNVVVDEGDEAP